MYTKETFAQEVARLLRAHYLINVSDIEIPETEHEDSTPAQFVEWLASKYDLEKFK